jgi:TDG/mug DNA glycosylase family protein
MVKRLNPDKSNAPLQCLAPIESQHALVLILGSMPGRASLQAQQYYAHPRNAFWQIMGRIVGAHPAMPYLERMETLRASGIALWDVLAACAREGSLDSDIDMASIRANDFITFFSTHLEITDVLLNGAMAHDCFVRHVLPSLAHRKLRIHRLPSTSPANASISSANKLAAWRAALIEANPELAMASSRNPLF